MEAVFWIVYFQWEKTVFADAISLFPNPATQEVFINISDKTFNSYDVTVLNSLGQTLERKESVSNASTARINVFQLCLWTVFY